MTRFRGMLWPVLLLVLLAVLAWLQFRWTGQVSVAEQERMQASLQSSVRRYAGDVDDEALLLFQFFRAERVDELDSRLERYRDEARYPELVSAIYFCDATGRSRSSIVWVRPTSSSPSSGPKRSNECANS